jgi:hypothetical protein
MLFEEVASSPAAFILRKLSSSRTDFELIEVSPSSANIQKTFISRPCGKDTNDTLHKFLLF